VALKKGGYKTKQAGNRKEEGNQGDSTVIELSPTPPKKKIRWSKDPGTRAQEINGTRSTFWRGIGKSVILALNLETKKGGKPVNAREGSKKIVQPATSR